MTMPFVKMQGCGNDYIYFDLFDPGRTDPGTLRPDCGAVACLCDRHFGVGGDGVVLLLPSDAADIRMRMFNADGSEGKMCGNAIRCIATLAAARGHASGSVVTVETASGVKSVRLYDGGAEADMGAPVFAFPAVPCRLAGDDPADVPLHTSLGTVRAAVLSMGNPHCVIFGDLPADPAAMGRAAAEALNEGGEPVFPEGVNVEFASVTGRSSLRVTVFERGSGLTLGCGTGACAAAAAAVRRGLCDPGQLGVTMPGGLLTVRYDDGPCLLSGNAETVFTGTAELPFEND